MKKNDDEPVVTPSCGNIFEDLGLPDSKELLIKARLAGAISDAIEERHLTQKEAAALIGISQPKISAIMRGYLEGFSIDRLIRFLSALDLDVEMLIVKKSA